MKTLNLHQNLIPTSETTGIGTADLIRGALNNKPPSGFTREDLRARDRVEAALDKAVAAGAPTLLLEDQDATTLQRCVAAALWNIRAPALTAFLDAVENIPTV